MDISVQGQKRWEFSSCRYHTAVVDNKAVIEWSNDQVFQRDMSTLLGQGFEPFSVVPAPDGFIFFLKREFIASFEPAGVPQAPEEQAIPDPSPEPSPSPEPEVTPDVVPEQ